jgi:hypothetical protein
LESILNEYRDRATNIARWQAQLQTTTDPGMRDYLQGLINSEQSILSTIATNAINAGATQEQLNQISTEAQTAAEGNAIELDTWDGGDSVALSAVIGWYLGSLQGVLNTANGVTDIGISTANLGINAVCPVGQLLGINPQIPLWDWSRGWVTDEDPALHEWSKWLGGNGVVTIFTIGLGAVFRARTSGLGNIGSHAPISADVALAQGESFLGPGYSEVAPGVFRSADRLRQFRFTTADLLGSHGSIGPHLHFESLDVFGRILENLHIPIY